LKADGLAWILNDPPDHAEAPRLINFSEVSNFDHQAGSALRHIHAITARLRQLSVTESSVTLPPNAGKRSDLNRTVLDRYRTTSLHPLQNADDAGTRLTGTNWF
jgi:hypothetical protein